MFVRKGCKGKAQRRRGNDDMIRLLSDDSKNSVGGNPGRSVQGGDWGKERELRMPTARTERVTGKATWGKRRR